MTGAVQDQIDASVEDAVERTRRRLPRGESLLECEACGAEIPEGRREALPGVRLGVGVSERARWTGHAARRLQPSASWLFAERSGTSTNPVQ